MAHHNIATLFSAWRSHIDALSNNCDRQVESGRARRGLNVGVQNRLSKKKANKKALLGTRYEPNFVRPRGKAWIKVAVLSGL